MATQRTTVAAPSRLHSTKATRGESVPASRRAAAKGKRAAEEAEARALLDSFGPRLAEAHAQIDEVLRRLKDK